MWCENFGSFAINCDCAEVVGAELLLFCVDNRWSVRRWLFGWLMSLWLIVFVGFDFLWLNVEWMLFGCDCVCYLVVWNLICWIWGGIVCVCGEAWNVVNVLIGFHWCGVGELLWNVMVWNEITFCWNILWVVILFFVFVVPALEALWIWNACKHLDCKSVGDGNV